MGEDAVLQLTQQAMRKTGNPSAGRSDQLASHHDMPEQLSVIGVVIGRKIRDFLQLSHIMKCGCRDEKVMVQVRIRRAEKLAHLHHTQRMLTQASDKAVMNRLCRGVPAKRLLKRRIVEILIDQGPEPLVLYAAQNLLQLSIHRGCVILTDRQIVLGTVFTRPGDPYALDIQLQVILKGRHLADNIDIVIRCEFFDSRGIRLPDLTVNRAAPVLQRYVLIFFPCLRGSLLAYLTQIYVSNMISLLQRSDQFHDSSFLHSLSGYGSILPRCLICGKAWLRFTADLCLCMLHVTP